MRYIKKKCIHSVCQMIAVAHLQARPDYSGFSVFSDSDLERQCQRWWPQCLCNPSDELGKESVAQSKSTRSRKPELSTMERGHHMDGGQSRARLCGRPEISPVSNSV